MPDSNKTEEEQTVSAVQPTDSPGDAAPPNKRARAKRSSGPVTPPAFLQVFDWKLIVAIAALAVLAVMSCDLVNFRLDNRLAPAAQRLPDLKRWKTGNTVAVNLTLITKDAARLACADDAEFEGRHCEFTSKKTRRAKANGAPVDDNRATLIQPYRTAQGNHLVMIAGLWATPELAMRRHQEPSRNVADAKLKRFVARCKLRFLGDIAPVDVRWNYSSKWYTEKKAPIALAESCKIVG